MFKSVGFDHKIGASAFFRNRHLFCKDLRELGFRHRASVEDTRFLKVGAHRDTGNCIHRLIRPGFKEKRNVEDDNLSAAGRDEVIAIRGNQWVDDVFDDRQGRRTTRNDLSQPCA